MVTIYKARQLSIFMFHDFWPFPLSHVESFSAHEHFSHSLANLSRLCEIKSNNSQENAQCIKLKVFLRVIPKGKGKQAPNVLFIVFLVNGHLKNYPD